MDGESARFDYDQVAGLSPDPSPGSYIVKLNGERYPIEQINDTAFLEVLDSVKKGLAKRS